MFRSIKNIYIKVKDKLKDKFNEPNYYEFEEGEKWIETYNDETYIKELRPNGDLLVTKIPKWDF